ncbi:HAD-like protein, partial [Leucogyrophana mollusca]
LVVDIGDVLFTWSPHTKTSLSPKVLKLIMSSPTWFDYERGRVSQEECYDTLARDHHLEVLDIREAFAQARTSLRPNTELISLIRDLKAQSNGRLRVYAMSNISLPDYHFLLAHPSFQWAVFDRIFASAEAGERKPNFAFYEHVLKETGMVAEQAIFVDDKLENVISARSFGFHGIVYDDCEKVMRTLRNLLEDPAQRGQNFLTSNAKQLHSVYANGLELRENFSQLLILEATKNFDLISLKGADLELPRTWNFFQDKPMFTTDTYPFDVDTTSLALSILPYDHNTVSSVMDEMIGYINADGIIQTYFDHTRPRIDPVVCVNALMLFYTFGRASELQQTLQWVHRLLLHRAYLDGTRYYTAPESFLFFLARLLERAQDPELDALLKPLLRKRIQEQIGKNGDSVALAMRVLACVAMGLQEEVEVDMRSLLGMQCEDGGWEAGWVYRQGSTGIKIGNRGLATALAVKAV